MATMISPPTADETLKVIAGMHQAGHQTVRVTLRNGESANLRLFVSRGGELCYKAPRRKNRGYRLSEIAGTITEIRAGNVKPPMTNLERYTDSLRRFKRLFETKCHPNLWPELQDGYRRLDIDDFVSRIPPEVAKDGHSYDFYKVLGEYRKEKGIDIITENWYKTTTIRSNKPFDRGHYQYGDCQNRLAGLLDRRENFEFGWESSYDISVSGKLCPDGAYRAWMSLEFRGCGNGHYYLLINENTAVFSEDD